VGHGPHLTIQRIWSAVDKDHFSEAFLNHLPFAFHIARFPEAERRRLLRMICMKSTGRRIRHRLRFPLTAGCPIVTRSRMKPLCGFQPRGGSHAAMEGFPANIVL